MTERKYLPTFAELVDRLSITILKSVFIPDHKAEYDTECAAIEHDLDLILCDEPFGSPIGAKKIRAMLVLMLVNRYIWENESIARQGGDGQDKRLKLTHSINGVRSTAKNILALGSERKDYKIDCFAAELTKEFGNWNLFE